MSHPISSLFANQTALLERTTRKQTNKVKLLKERTKEAITIDGGHFNMLSLKSKSVDPLAGEIFQNLNLNVVLMVPQSLSRSCGENVLVNFKILL